MKSALTAGELSNLRGRLPKVTWRLAVHRPRTIFAAEVTAVPTYPIGEVSYGTILVSVGALMVGYTVLVGSSVGDRSKGICRARGYGSGKILVGETGLGTIDWQVGDVVTVIEEYRPWPKFPRFLEDGTVYVDYDTAYTSQNEFMGPQAIMGPPVVAREGETVYFVDERCVDWDGVGFAFLFWFLPDGGFLFGPGTEGAPLSYTYPGGTDYSDGRYMTLSVYDNNGRVHDGHRLTWIFPEDAPADEADFVAIQGGLDSGGYEATVRVYDDDLTRLTEARYPIGSECVIWEDAAGWSDDTSGSIGGNFPYRSNIVFRGWILSERLRLKPGESVPYLELRLGSIERVMARMRNYPLFLEGVASPASWLEMASLTPDRAMWHYVYRRSTISNITDIYRARSYAESQTLPSLSLDPGTIRDQLWAIYTGRNGFGPFGLVACDLQSSIWCDLDAQVQTPLERTAYPLIATLTDEDRLAEAEIERPSQDDVARYTIYGLQGSDPRGAQSPGEPMAALGGSTREYDGIVVPDQATLNAWVGHLRARANNRHKNLAFPLQGPYRIDPVPQSRVNLTLDTELGGQRYSWTAKTFWPRSLSLRLAGGSLLAELGLEADTTGLEGETIEISDVAYNPPGAHGVWDDVEFIDYGALPDPPDWGLDVPSVPPGPPLPALAYNAQTTTRNVSAWLLGDEGTNVLRYAEGPFDAPPTVVSPATTQGANVLDDSATTVYLDMDFQTAFATPSLNDDPTYPIALDVTEPSKILLGIGETTGVPGANRAIYYKSADADPTDDPWDLPWRLLISAASVEALLPAHATLFPGEPWSGTPFLSYRLTRLMTDRNREGWVGAVLAAYYAGGSQAIALFLLSVEYSRASGILTVTDSDVVEIDSRVVTLVSLDTPYAVTGVAMGVFDASRRAWSADRQNVLAVAVDINDNGALTSQMFTLVTDYTGEWAVAAPGHAREVTFPDGSTELDPSTTRHTALWIDPGDPRVVILQRYVSDVAGAWMRSSGGVWTALAGGMLETGSSFNGHVYFDYSAAPGPSQDIYYIGEKSISTEVLFYRSQDGGATWSLVEITTDGGSGSDTVMISGLGDAPGELWLASTGRLFVADAGPDGFYARTDDPGALHTQLLLTRLP
jgi:hypothetical protein